MEPRRKDWTNILFLCGSPLVGVLGTAAYALRYGVAWWEPALCLALFFATGLSIGAGYHRLFAHRAYECPAAVRAVFLFFGALALQNSVLFWARDHRDHHRFVDTDRDPYNINRGGWYAHILWIFYRPDTPPDFHEVPDLTRDRLVMLQHRWGAVLGIVAGLGFPTLVGALFGRPVGGLLWGGFLRIVLGHHTTFFVNSVAHLWGSRPYSEENSSRDNWLLAFFTHGEGYHNFHHRFPSDFRNGIRWWQWDPNKWLIGLLKGVGLARALKATPPPLVDAVRLQVALARAERRLEPAPTELQEAVRVRVESVRRRLDEALVLWNEALRRRRDLAARGRRANAEAFEELKSELKAKIRAYKATFRAAHDEWRAALRFLSGLPGSA